MPLHRRCRSMPLSQGYDQVEIEFVMDYPKGDDPQAALRKEIWSAYKGI